MGSQSLIRTWVVAQMEEVTVKPLLATAVLKVAAFARFGAKGVACARRRCASRRCASIKSCRGGQQPFVPSSEHLMVLEPHFACFCMP